MFTDVASAKLLSVGEVANLLRLHTYSVYRKLNAGELPAILRGSRGRETK
jgi:excisionase family DNA binding protein